MSSFSAQDTAPALSGATINALDEAVGVFWRKGFDEASVEDLVQATGLNRYAIYRQYGDKQALFMKALERYNEMVGARFGEIFADETLPLVARLRTFLRWLIEEMTARDTGCLLCMAMTDLAPRDHAVAARCRTYFEGLGDAFEEQARRETDMSRLNAWITPEQARAMTVNFIIGQATRSRSHTPRAELERDVDAFVAMLAPVTQ